MDPQKEIEEGKGAFDPRYFVQQWIEAQAEVDRMLAGNELQETKPHHDATLHGHE